MIYTKPLLVAFICLLMSSLAQSANVDFNTIYYSNFERCNNNQSGKDSINYKDGVTSNEASKNKQCEIVKADKDYVEPKFSTKRPRGQ